MGKRLADYALIKNADGLLIVGKQSPTVGLTACAVGQ